MRRNQCCFCSNQLTHTHTHKGNSQLHSHTHTRTHTLTRTHTHTHTLSLSHTLTSIHTAHTCRSEARFTSHVKAVSASRPVCVLCIPGEVKDFLRRMARDHVDLSGQVHVTVLVLCSALEEPNVSFRVARAVRSTTLISELESDVQETECEPEHEDDSMGESQFDLQMKILRSASQFWLSWACLMRNTLSLSCRRGSR